MLHRLFAYRLSFILTGIIVALSLMPLPETPLNEVRFVDKYTHLLMYGGYALALWSETRTSTFLRYLLCFFWPVLLGGLLELGQTHLTSARQGDVYDFMANGLGVLLALPLGRYLHRNLAH